MPYPLSENYAGPDNMYYMGKLVQTTDSEKAAYKVGYADYPGHNLNPDYTDREANAYCEGNSDAHCAEKAEAEYAAGGYDEDEY